MKKWPLVPLGELCEVQNGYAFDSKKFSEEKGFPIIRIRNIKTGRTDTKYTGEFNDDFIVKNSDLIIGMDGEFNATIWNGNDALLNQRVCRIRNFKNCLKEYLYLAIKKPLKDIEANTDAVTVKHISSKQIQAIKLSLPPLLVQREIVAKLDAASDLKKKREEADKKMAEFAPALFYKMFGDSKYGAIEIHERLGDVVKVQSGSGFPLKYQGLRDQKIPFFKVSDMNAAVNQVEMIEANNSISEETAKKLRATIYPAGSVIFPKIGAAIHTNKKRLLVKPSCVDNNVMVVTPSELVHTRYLFNLFQTKHLDGFASPGNPPSIRKTVIEAWKIPVPTIKQQEQFVALIDGAENIRKKQKFSREKFDNIFDGLVADLFGSG